MKSPAWQNHSTAPIAIRLLSYFSVLALLFFLFHTVILFYFNTEIENNEYYVAPWTQEVYFNIWAALPVFLYITGKSRMQKGINVTLSIATGLFAFLYILNIGNAYEWVDIRHLQYPMSICLLIILVTWIVAVFKRKKTVLDALKFLWLFGFVYSFIVPRFVSSGHESGNFLLGSMFVFPFMMTLGLVLFYRKPKSSDYAA